MTEKKPYSQPQLFRVGAEPGAGHLKRLQFDRLESHGRRFGYSLQVRSMQKSRWRPVWATAVSGLPERRRSRWAAKEPYSSPQLFRVELNQEQAILSACSLMTMSALANSLVNGCRANG